jgi:hypothetical protein
MILRRKPASDEREFSDRIETHVTEQTTEAYPRPFRWDPINCKSLPGEFARFHFTLGERSKFSAVAVDVDWADICRCIELFACEGNATAIRLLPLIQGWNVLPRQTG